MLFDSNQMKSNLKKASEELEMEIYLNHYNTGAQNERKKRDRVIIAENKKKEKDYQVEIEKVQGGLKVGGKLYRKQVEEPKPGDLLKFTTEELDKILKFPVLRGPEIKKDDNTFIAYCVDTDKIQQVRDGYHKVRLMHASARHVVCVFNLPCKDGLTHLYSDYCDDEDIGVGSYILAQMKRSHVSHKALYIVRYCGKSKLNEDRLPCYLRAAVALIAQKPINGVTRSKQELKESLPRAEQKKSWPANARNQVSPKNANNNSGTKNQRTSIKKTYAETVSPR